MLEHELADIHYNDAFEKGDSISRKLRKLVDWKQREF